MPARPAAERREREEDGAGDEDPAAAEQVGGAAAEQHEPAVGEQVAAQHPLQVLHREVQVGADRGQRDVDDRRVDEVEERDAQSSSSVSLPRRVDRKDGRPGLASSAEMSSD